MISIIIPLYNMGRYVSRCLDSILNQNFQDYEVIIIDDGSTDNSSVIVEEYVNKDTRFHLYCKTNGGVSSARNYGLTKVSGDYCYFVDPDDELLPDCLYTLSINMNDGIDIVVCGYNRVDKGELIYTPNTIVERKFTSYLFMDELLRSSYLPTVVFCINLFRYSIIKQNELLFNTDIHIYEDLLFMVKYLSCCSNSVFFTTKPIYNYNIESGVMTSRFLKYNKKIITGFDARCQVYDLIRQGSYSNRAREISRLGVFYEYKNVQRYLRKFKHDDDVVKLEQQLFNTLSRKVYIKYLIRDYIKKIFYPILPFLRYLRNGCNKLFFTLFKK